MERVAPGPERAQAGRVHARRRHGPRVALVLLAALAIASLLVSPTATAAPEFGSQVRVGDPDHIPLTKFASIAVSVNQGGFGRLDLATDDCILLDTNKDPAAGAHFKDLRLTPCGGKAPGTLLADDDAMEKTAGYPQVDVTVQTVDVDSS